jgi:large subunit ribosomal protein L37Ae
MTRTAKVGPAGSLGPRYGTVARKRYAEIVSNLRKRSECPRCHIMAVRRESVGVWFCSKCGYKFAGGAYIAQTELGEVARRATGGVALGTVAKTSGLVETRKEAVERKEAEPRKRRVRRTKTQEASEESKSSS